MPDPGLINFTRSSKANGKSEAEIIDVLRQNGQNEAQIRLILDTAAGLLPSPSGIESINETTSTINPLKQRFAGFGVRFLAEIIDLIPFLFLSQFLPTYSLPFLYFTYKIVMLRLYSASVGKIIVGVKVISDDGKPLSTLQIILRELLGKILSQLFFYAGYIMVAFTRNKQGLHDMIASTYVVYRKNQF